jgi:hypothetical protein
MVGLLAILLSRSLTPAVELKTAAGSAMKYYASLPDGWTAKKTWPVVLAIPGAERDFEESAKLFAQARGQKPYIVVVPMVVTNGGSSYRGVPTYRYSEQTWQEITRQGEYAFDMAGIAAVLADVKKACSGDKVYATAFEAGCHTLFALTFRHPEWLSASIPNAPNYQGRGVDEAAFSKSASRVSLPIHEIHGSDDPFCARDKPFYAQWQSARAEAKGHGFSNISTQSVPGKGHVWLAAEILSYLDSIRK